MGQPAYHSAAAASTGRQHSALRTVIDLPKGRRQEKYRQKDTTMTDNKFTVGLHLGGVRRSVIVTAEDALMAALKVKLEQPAAAINFVRRCNRRGDLRHPHDAATQRH
jgi:hypothetical protein